MFACARGNVRWWFGFGENVGMARMCGWEEAARRVMREAEVRGR